MSIVGMCGLCQEEKTLCESHLVPSFVGKWQKETSATGFLRAAENPNIPRQDVHKLYLFCRNCEEIFQVPEKNFKERIFEPYTSFLENDIYVENDHTYSYDSWLLKFVISLQYRVLIDPNKKWSSPLDPKQNALVAETTEVWRAFLRGSRADSGNNESYVCFMRAVPPGAESDHPIDDQVNLYLLRCGDAFEKLSKQGSYVLSKLGPLVLITSLKPKRLEGLENHRIKWCGEISTRLLIRNPHIGHELLIARPKLIMGLMKVSENQKKRFWNLVGKNPGRYLSSMTLMAQMADKRRNTV